MSSTPSSGPPAPPDRPAPSTPSVVWRGAQGAVILPAERQVAAEERRRLRATVLLAVCGAYLVAYWAWLLAPALGTGLRPTALAMGLAHLPFGLMPVVAAWYAAATPGLVPDTRRAWHLMAAAYLMVWLASSAWGLYEVLGRVRASWVDPLALLWYPLALAGLLSVPAAPRGQAGRGKFWLDVGAVLVAGLVLGWQHIGSTAADAGRPGLDALVFPLGDLMVLVATTVIVLRAPVGATADALRLFVAALLVATAADLMAARQAMDGGSWSDGWTNALWAAASWGTAVAAWAQRRGTGDRAGDADLDAGQQAAEREAALTRARAYSIFPYAGVAAVYAQLLWESRVPPGPDFELALGAVALTVFVVARQFLALRENAALVAERLAQEARFRSLVQGSSDVMVVLDAAGRIGFVSPSVSRVFDYPAEGLLGTRLMALVHKGDRALMEAFLAEASARASMTAPITWRARHPRDGWRHVETVATNLLHDPAVRGVVLNTRDITERAALEQQLTFQAFHDALTGLPNRVRFGERTARALADAEAAGDPGRVAVLLLDLDGFKHVNDSLGHAAGDQLLEIVARRLLHATRGCDTVARLGGDEFGVLLENVADDAQAITVAERILAAFEVPFDLGGTQAFAGTSVGIARGTDTRPVTPREDADAVAGAVAGSERPFGAAVHALLRGADAAMYRAKGRGKGQWARYAPDMHLAAVERLAMDTDFRAALARQEFRLAYQPIVDLVTGQIVGVEALVRWQHPRRGLLMPGAFIDFAEETALVVPLGRWVLGEACRQAAKWQAARTRRGSAAKPLTIAVNVSGRQLDDAGFVTDVAGALAASGLAPDTLVLELTERTLVEHSATLKERLMGLKLLGVRLAIDDFGTGYSALSYLPQFPFDVLKIDKVFVDRITHDGAHVALAKTILSLAEGLRLRCVAEGIERPEQRTALQALGCPMGQGHLFAGALPAAEIAALLAAESAAYPMPVVNGGPVLKRRTATG